MATLNVIGFDSAWTDKPDAPGAVCCIDVDGEGIRRFEPPHLANFDSALTYIELKKSKTAKCLVAIDQPTIVPNLKSLRPVQRVVSGLVSWTGGGVQPANRSKTGMFDDAAPIWNFLRRLGAIENPELSRAASDGLFVIEVFPALALLGMSPGFCERLAGPRYNPDRKTFQMQHWHAVTECLRNFPGASAVQGLNSWLLSQSQIARPRKADQDKLDSAICAIVGFHWLTAKRTLSTVIGDIRTGYMVAPVLHGIHPRLMAKAGKYLVSFDSP